MIRSGDTKSALLGASPSGYMSKKSATEIERMKHEAKRQRAKKAAASASNVQVRGKMPNGVFSEPRKIRSDVDDTLATSIKSVLPDYASFTNALNAKEAHLYLGIDNSVPATPEVKDNEELLAGAFVAREGGTDSKIPVGEHVTGTSKGSAKSKDVSSNLASKASHMNQIRDSLPAGATGLKLKPPSLLVNPLKEISTLDNQRVNQTKIESILKEMTQDIGPPLTDIETPVKGKGFAFPKAVPEEHVNGIVDPMLSFSPEPEQDKSQAEAVAAIVKSATNNKTIGPVHRRHRGLSTSSTSSSDDSGSESDSDNDSSDTATELTRTSSELKLDVQDIPFGLLNASQHTVTDMKAEAQHLAVEVKPECTIPEREVDVDEFHSILDNHPEIPCTVHDVEHLSLLEKTSMSSTSDNSLQPQSAPNVYLMSSSVIGSGPDSNGGFSLIPNPNMYAEFNLEKPISPLPSDRLFDASPDHETLTSPFATAMDCGLFDGADELNNLVDSSTACTDDNQLKMPTEFPDSALSSVRLDQSDSMDISDNEQDGDVKPIIICHELSNDVVATPSLPSATQAEVSSKPRIHPVIEMEQPAMHMSNRFLDNNNYSELLPMDSLKVKIPLAQINLQQVPDSNCTRERLPIIKQTLEYHSNGPGKPPRKLVNGLPEESSMLRCASDKDHTVFSTSGMQNSSLARTSTSGHNDLCISAGATVSNSSKTMGTSFANRQAATPKSLPVQIKLALLERIPRKVKLDACEADTISVAGKKRTSHVSNASALPLVQNGEYAKSLADYANVGPLKSSSDVVKSEAHTDGKEQPARKRTKKIKDNSDASSLDSNICTSCGTLRIDSGNTQSRTDAYRTSYEKHLTQGRKLKHVADGYTDFKEKGHKYIEAVLSYLQFLVGLEASKKTDSKTGLEQFMQVNSQCITLVDHVSNHYARKKTKSHPVVDRRFLYLCLRMQSMLYFKLFNTKKESTTKISKLLSEYYKAFKPRATAGPSPYSSTNRSLSASPPYSPNPSPGGSVASYGSSGSSGSAEKGGPTVQSMMSIPVDMYQKAQQYLTQTKFLLHGNRLWDEGSVVAESCEDFARELALGVGTLTMQSSLLHLIDYSTAGLMLIQRNPTA